MKDKFRGVVLGLVLGLVSFGLISAVISSHKEVESSRPALTRAYTLLNNQSGNTTGDPATVWGFNQFTFWLKYTTGTANVELEALVTASDGETLWNQVDTWTSSDSGNIIHATIPGAEKLRAKVTNCSSCDITLEARAWHPKGQ